MVVMDFHAVFTLAAQGTALMRCVLYTALPALRTEVLLRLNKAHMKVMLTDNAITTALIIRSVVVLLSLCTNELRYRTVRRVLQILHQLG
jgi:hypothetical protein